MLVKKQQLEPEMKKMGLFQIGKEICQGCVLSLCLFNFMQSASCEAWLEEAQDGFKIAGRSINNLRYADGTAFMAESE